MVYSRDAFGGRHVYMAAIGAVSFVVSSARRKHLSL
jgi:hypothetical protein